MAPEKQPKPKPEKVESRPVDPQEETKKFPAPMTPVGFEGSSALAEIPIQEGGVAAIARDEGELKAGVIMAKKFPRNELAAYNRLMRSCERPSLAGAATYCFPRGGQNIEGPSVDLAREAARCWGNIRYGLRIVADTEDQIHIQGVAFDLETNNLVSAEDKFKKLVQRKDRGTGTTNWVKPDERDLRELINRRGAICVRNALLQLLPPDVIDDAVMKAKETVKKAASGELKQDRKKAISGLISGFAQLGVSVEMLSKYLDHDLEIVNDEELATLRGIWKSIHDGNSRREEHFEVTKPRTAETGSIDMGSIAPKTGEEPAPKK